MDGRWKLGLAGGFLASLMGCAWNKQSQPSFPVDPPPPVPHSANSIYVPEPADDAAKKDGPLATSTLILFANMWVESVAGDPTKPAADRERLLTQARATYQEVLQREPKNVDALLGLGHMYQVTGEQAKLAEVEQKLRSMHAGSAKVWAWMAVRHAQAKDWDTAAECYHQAAKLEPDNRVYRIHLGFTLARAERYEEGYAWLSRCMKESEARYNLAMMMIHNGHAEKAKKQLGYALQMDANFKAASDQLTALANPNTPAPRPLMPDIRTVGHEEKADGAPARRSVGGDE
ncbi:MAG TPA: tetratricopeptide repeat protein [Gemmataceae bacterium]|nr:tetratricopeptide repeat protein [Gemmataceae bacterium]